MSVKSKSTMSGKPILQSGTENKFSENWHASTGYSGNDESKYKKMWIEAWNKIHPKVGRGSAYYIRGTEIPEYAKKYYGRDWNIVRNRFRKQKLLSTGKFTQDENGLLHMIQIPKEETSNNQPPASNLTPTTSTTTNRQYTSTLDIPKYDDSKTYYTPVHGQDSGNGTIDPKRVGDDRMVETGPTTESLGQAINQSQQAEQTVPQEEYNPYGYRQPSVIRGQFGQIAVNPDTGQAVFGGAFSRRQGRAMHNLGQNYVDNLGNEWDMGRLNRRDIRFMRRSMNRTGRRIANEINNLQGAYETLYGSLAGGPGWNNFFEQWRQNKANNMINAGKQMASDMGYQQPAASTSNTPRFDAYNDWTKNNQGSYFDFYKSTSQPNTQQDSNNSNSGINPNTGISRQFDNLMDNYYKTRGYQQGGKMNDEQLQQAFIQFLAQKSGAKNEKELEAYVKQLGEDGLKQAYAEFTQVMQKQAQKAKQGAKLNYIKQLKHQCPEGYEPYYYKKGGIVNCGCGKKMKKAEEGTKMSAVERFKVRKGMDGYKNPPQNNNNTNNKTIWTDKDEKEMHNLAVKNAQKKATSQEQKRLKELQEKFKNSTNQEDYELQEGKCGGKIKKHQNGGTLVRFLQLGGGEITRRPSVTKPLPQQRQTYYNRPIMMTQPAKTNGQMLAERASQIVGNFGALARVPVKAAYNWMTSPAGTNIKNQEARVNRNKTSWDLGERFLGLKNGGNLK